MKKIIAIVAAAITITSFAGVQVTKKYCDANMYNAISNSEALTRFMVPGLVEEQVPDAVTNYMKEEGIPEVKTNVVIIEHFDTNYVTTVTNIIEHRYSNKIVDTNATVVADISALNRLYSETARETTVITQNSYYAQASYDAAIQFKTNFLYLGKSTTFGENFAYRYSFDPLAGSDKFYYLCSDTSLGENNMRIRCNIVPEFCITPSSYFMGRKITATRVCLKVVDGYIGITGGVTNYVTATTFPSLGQYIVINGTWGDYDDPETWTDIWTTYQRGTGGASRYYPFDSYNNQIDGYLLTESGTRVPSGNFVWNKLLDSRTHVITNYVTTTHQLAIYSDACIAATNEASKVSKELFNATSNYVEKYVTGFMQTNATATIAVGTVTQGSPVRIVNSGTSKHAVFDFTLPKGDKGDTGDAAGFGTATATASLLPSGSLPTASATMSGPNTAKNLSFTFGIPKGDKGDTGDDGQDGKDGHGLITTIPLVSTYPQTTWESLFRKGAYFEILESSSKRSGCKKDDFFITSGVASDTYRTYICFARCTNDVGNVIGESIGLTYVERGIQGPATIRVNSVTTLPAGRSARVENVGTETDMRLDFYIPMGIQGNTGSTGPQGGPGPQGNPGPRGEPGPSTIKVGKTYSISPDSTCFVTNIGTASDLELDFYIPAPGAVERILAQKLKNKYDNLGNPVGSGTWTYELVVYPNNKLVGTVYVNTSNPTITTEGIFTVYSYPFTTQGASSHTIIDVEYVKKYVAGDKTSPPYVVIRAKSGNYTEISNWTNFRMDDTIGDDTRFLSYENSSRVNLENNYYVCFQCIQKYTRANVNLQNGEIRSWASGNLIDIYARKSYVDTGDSGAMNYTTAVSNKLEQAISNIDTDNAKYIYKYFNYMFNVILGNVVHGIISVDIENPTVVSSSGGTICYSYPFTWTKTYSSSATSVIHVWKYVPSSGTPYVHILLGENYYFQVNSENANTWNLFTGTNISSPNSNYKITTRVVGDKMTMKMDDFIYDTSRGGPWPYYYIPKIGVYNSSGTKVSSTITQIEYNNMSNWVERTFQKK